MPFIFGILAAAMALFTQLVLWFFYPPLFEIALPVNITILASLFLLALIEESARISFAKQYKKTFGMAKKSSVLSFALGFASLEVLFAFWQQNLDKALLVPVSIHILLSFLAFSGLQKCTQKVSLFGLFLGLVLTHFLLNTLLLYL